MRYHEGGVVPLCLHAGVRTTSIYVLVVPVGETEVYRGLRATPTIVALQQAFPVLREKCLWPVLLIAAGSLHGNHDSSAGMGRVHAPIKQAANA